MLPVGFLDGGLLRCSRLLLLIRGFLPHSGGRDAEGINGENDSGGKGGGTVVWLVEEEYGEVEQKTDESRRSVFPCS